MQNEAFHAIDYPPSSSSHHGGNSLARLSTGVGAGHLVTGTSSCCLALNLEGVSDRRVVD